MNERELPLVDVSVIVCTYNRADSLPAALSSIAAQIMPANLTWEVLVVDNNSTDETRAVVATLESTCPRRFRFVRESRQGLSFARNTGVHEARGVVVVFTDDDVIVEKEWLRNLTAELISGGWAGCGGRIVPTWTKPAPKWLPLNGIVMSGPFVALDLGPDPKQMNQAPVGANMAFRKEMFAKYGAFRTDLGRTGNILRGCEDSEFGMRLLEKGERFRYEPHAVVYHPVPDSRLKKSYLLAWCFGHSHSAMFFNGVDSGKRWLVAGVPLYLLRRMCRWSVQWLFSGTASKRFICTLSIWSIAGEIVACRRLAKGKNVAQAMTAVSGALNVCNGDYAGKPLGDELCQVQEPR